MLSFIRKWLTSWPVIVLLGLVLVAFVVTGVGDPFASGGGTGGDLAKVGRARVDAASVVDRLDRVLVQAREQQPGLTQAQAARDGAVEQVTEQLAASAALEEFARRHGIAVSDRAVDGAIASIDAFRVGGKFDQATYERLLAQQRLPEREFRDGLRSEMIRRQLVVPAGSGAQVPRGLALPYARLLLDVHEGAGAQVPPPAVAPPTAAQVASFYAANKARFVTAERRGFRYAMIDRAEVASRVTVTPAEVQAEYDKNREAYGGLEQRRLSQLVLPDAAKAQAFAAAVKGGQDFAAAAAKATGASASDVAIGLLTRDRYAAATSKPLADQVFTAAPGSVVGPVRTDFGFNVVRVDAVVAPQGKSLAALTPTITAKLRDTKAEIAMAERINAIEDGLATGKSFADTIKENSLVALSVAPVTKDGAGAPPEAVPVVAKAFDLDPADDATVADLGSGRYALIELSKVESPAPQPLAQIQPQVIAAWTADARSKAAKAVADSVIADVAKGTSFAAALAKRGLPAPRPIKGRRIDVAQQQQIPPVIRVFLTMAAGTTRALAAPDGSMLLVHVAKITPGDVAAVPQLLDSTRTELAQSTPDELTSAFGKALEREIGVTYNTAAIAATKQRLIGDAGAAK